MAVEYSKRSNVVTVDSTQKMNMNDFIENLIVFNFGHNNFPRIFHSFGITRTCVENVVLHKVVTKFSSRSRALTITSTQKIYMSFFIENVVIFNFGHDSFLRISHGFGVIADLINESHVRS